MTYNAKEEDITNVIEFSGHQLTRDEAAQLLSISGHDVGMAVNKLFEAPGGIAEVLKQSSHDNTWDGTAFGADRYGHQEGSQLPSFNIECVDDSHNSIAPSAAPSRPPSRTSQRSVLSTHVDDTPMQSVESNQESGVIGSVGSTGSLRPATQEYYDNASWALTTTKNAEYIPDAALSFQMRKPGEPGFIKPVLGPDCLPALLTILHSIPLIRNVLLAPELSAENYWRGEDWWKGSASGASITVDNGAGIVPAPELDLVYETQRLMAFLDSSERSYASLESLFHLDAWKEHQLCPEEQHSLVNDDVIKYLLRWSWAYQKHVPSTRLDGLLRSVILAGGKREESFVLDGTVIPEHASLYDVLDDALFVDEDRSAHILDISDVIILRLMVFKDGSQIGCRVPETLFADRYLEKNREFVEKMFAEKKQGREELRKIESEVERLKYHAPQRFKNKQKVEALNLLKTSMRAFESNTEAMTESPRDVAVLAQLQSLHDTIEQKLLDLEEQKKIVQAEIDNVSTRFHVSADDDSDSSLGYEHAYKLCGIATSSTEYYVRGDDKDDPEAVDKQWWHINYSYITSDDSAQIFRHRVSLGDARKAASESIDRVLLVYANQKAFSPEPELLSAKLESFVKKDNTNLHREMTQVEEPWQDHQDDDGSKVLGDWMSDNLPQYDDDWNAMSAKTFHEQNDSKVSSSATLTPNTDNEIVGGMEMQEVNGGISAWEDMSGSISSGTMAGEPMELSPVGQRQQSLEDVRMAEAGEPKVEHIEKAEKRSD